MGCLSVILRKISDIAVTLRRIGGGTTGSLTQMGGISAEMSSQGGIKVSMQKKGGITGRLGLVCETNLGQGILWASDGRLITFEGGFLIVEH